MKWKGGKLKNKMDTRKSLFTHFTSELWHFLLQEAVEAKSLASFKWGIDIKNIQCYHNNTCICFDPNISILGWVHQRHS